ncbi:MAG TPA: RidA family protein [Gemmatimonadales bacterium]|nr:RidA family protein [Gemmatimonadales bacterium]
MRLYILLIGLALLPASVRSQQPGDTGRAQKRVIQVPGSLPGLPFSSAVQVGNVIYLSGQVGVLPGTRQLVDTGVTKQTQQTLENIKAVLTHAGSSMERVFKCTVFLANMRDYDDMNRAYAVFFPKDPPARSTVAGSGLALGAKVEIECLALAGT